MNKLILAVFLSSLFLLSCSSLWKDFDEKLLENKEFDESVRVKELTPAPVAAGETPPATPATETKPPPPAPAGPKALPKKSKAAAKQAEVKTPVAAPPAKPKAPAKHEPSIEDGEGFDGRKPLVNPFREGEEITYIVSYFAMEAGRFVTKIRPSVEVNGRKSYHMTYHARSSSVFSMLYAVDDSAEVFLDHELLVPHSYTIKARESKQVRDVKTFFNWKTNKAKMWDKKIKKGKGPEERNIEWDLLPYSQNVFSAPFYLRTFKLAVGKELAVRVAHDGKNIIMRAKVLRAEKLKTSAGTFDTLVIKPSFELEGVFKPVGDIFLWLTDDDKKMLVRLESKIKIGTIVVSAESIK